MNRVRRIAVWLWRAWPFIVMALLAGMHWAWVCAVPIGQVNWIHKWVSAFAQLGGGAVVIYSFSKNLGSFGKGGLKAVFVGWVRAFPWTPRSYTFTPETGHFSFTGHAPMIVMSGGTRTLEQRLADAEEQIKGLTSNLAKVEHEIQSKIGQLTDALSKSEARLREAIAGLNDKVTQTAVGGLMPQVFGVLLVSYGVWLGAYMQP